MTDEQTAKRWKEFKFKREEIKAEREREREEPYGSEDNCRRRRR